MSRHRWSILARWLALGRIFVALPAEQQRSMLRARLLIPVLKASNRWSTRAVCGTVPAVVSLTTYGARLTEVYLTIESVARSAHRPHRLILWLDDQTGPELPIQLTRLITRGLEVRRCEDLASYKKVVPYAESTTAHTQPMASIDDDILYPRSWLINLFRCYREDPSSVSCYRARVVQLVGGAIAPYSTWPFTRTTEPHTHNFATGNSGVIYPPRFLDALRDAGRLFVEMSPKADDVWLHHIAVDNGFTVRQVHSQAKDFPMIPWSQQVTLTTTNVGDRMNDEYIRRTYSSTDLRRITESVAATSSTKAATVDPTTPTRSGSRRGADVR